MRIAPNQVSQWPRTFRPALRHGVWAIAAAGVFGIVGLAVTTATPPALPPAPAPIPAPAAAAPAAEPIEVEAVVRLTSGQQMEGILIEQSAGKVVLRIGGIETTFPADKVLSVTKLPPVTERYAAMRAAIEDSDAEQLVALSEWLMRRGQLELAKAELDALLQRQPANGPAKRLQDLVRTQIMLRDSSPVDANRSTSAPDANGDPDASDGAARPGIEPTSIPLLSAEQINLMKVFEVDLTRPPPLVIARETMMRVMEQFSGHPLVPASREGREAILRQTPAEQLNLLFALKARDAYGQVRVQGQPESMSRFRDAVLTTYVLNSCATNACHGGLDAGRLVLMNRRPNSDATVYSNFYILEHFRTAGDKPLLDYDNPERSILLQAGLPRADSLFKHPVVPRGENQIDAWRPAFRSPTDRRFTDTMAWIRSMYRPRPDYKIDYKPLRPLTVEAPAPGNPPAAR